MSPYQFAKPKIEYKDGQIPKEFIKENLKHLLATDYSNDPNKQALFFIELLKELNGHKKLLISADYYNFINYGLTEEVQSLQFTQGFEDMRVYSGSTNNPQERVALYIMTTPISPANSSYNIRIEINRNWAIRYESKGDDAIFVSGPIG